MAYIAIQLIKLYRVLLSTILGGQCRFYPSCSHYAEEAIRKYGFLKGFFMGLRRVLHCHPFNPGGYDPVR